MLCRTMQAAPSETDDGANFLLTDDGDDTDLRLARLEALAVRRPELLSSVMLRQNPHNVGEWHKRVKLFEGQPTRQILTYTEAVKTVDVDKALGKPHSLWVAFARFYERHGDVVNARVIFDKATQVGGETVQGDNCGNAERQMSKCSDVVRTLPRLDIHCWLA